MDSVIDQAQLQHTSPEKKLITFREFIDKMIAESYVMKELPEEMIGRNHVVMLRCPSSAERGECHVYLIGTDHVSMESCQQVEAVINYLKPQVVFLELCKNRVDMLSSNDIEVPTMGEMVELWKKNHNVFGILYTWYLAKLASKVDVFPGSDCRVAYEAAMKYGGKVLLGDRRADITIRRTWLKMPLWHKAKLICALILRGISLPSSEHHKEEMNETDNIDVMSRFYQEMSVEFPTMLETLVNERDQYMSSMLLFVASQHNSVVAVVGKGHLEGIKKHWQQPVAIRELLLIPSATPIISARTMLSIIGVAVTGLATAWCVYYSGSK